MKIIKRGDRIVLAEPSASTVTVVRYEFDQLLPLVLQARAYVRQEEGHLTAPELRKAFRRTQLAKRTDEELRDLIHEYGEPKKRAASPGGIARAYIRARMGLTDETIKTYLKRTRKPKSPTIPYNHR
ncbi:MAG: hypothetical protein ABSA41_10055 [Terriglobia bacterium]|jgi:hypothetical protein